MEAALRCFARSGYSGASVQEIIASTPFSKPTLYYHFQSKEGLFRTLVNSASDECYRRMREAAAKSEAVGEQLEEILTSLFEFLSKRKDLTRLAFSTSFAAPDEVPANTPDVSRRRRNFECMHSVIREALRKGVLDKAFDSKELTRGIYGALNYHLMANLLFAGTKLNRAAARQIVKLFLVGAAAKPPESAQN